MERDDQLLVYRVGKLEDAVTSIAGTQDELRDFVLTIKVWMKVIAAIWGVLVLIVAGVAVRYLVGG